MPVNQAKLQKLQQGDKSRIGGKVGVHTAVVVMAKASYWIVVHSWISDMLCN